MKPLGMIVLGIAFLGCGGSNTSDGGGTAPTFSLKASDTKLRSAIAQLSAPGGTIYADVGLTLANISESKPLPANLLMFSLQTKGALVLGADPASAGLSPACPTNVNVAMGGMVSCRVAFSMPMSDAPDKLLYNDMTGRTASASVPPVPGDCTGWSLPQSKACQGCIMTAYTMNGACTTPSADVRKACASELGQSCLDLSVLGCAMISQASNCMGSAACLAALKEYRDCLYTACNAKCR
jgi:hypothetical protein